MNLCDFYLGGMLEDKAYSNNPRNEDDIKKSIVLVMNVSDMCHKGLQAKRNHF